MNMNYCANCGAATLKPIDGGLGCITCNREFYENTPTVAVAIVRVRRTDGTFGALVIERGDGGIAFPGGFQGKECIREAMTRELEEELGIELPNGEENWEMIHFETTPNRAQNLYFALFRGVLNEDALPIFAANHEVTRRLIVGPEAALKFPIHTKVLNALERKRFFDRTDDLSAERPYFDCAVV